MLELYIISFDLTAGYCQYQWIDADTVIICQYQWTDSDTVIICQYQWIDSDTVIICQYDSKTSLVWFFGSTH